MASQSFDFDSMISLHLKEHFRYLAQKSGLNLHEVGAYLRISAQDPRFICNFIVGHKELSSSHEFSSLLAPSIAVGEPFAWFSNLENQSLSETLTSWGLSRVGDLTGVGLAIDRKEAISTFANTALNISTLHNSHVMQVTTEEHYQTWCRLHFEVWGRPAETAYYLFKGLFLSQVTDLRVRLYLVMHEGKYAGGCALDIQATVAGCYWAFILPEFRKKGLATLMVQERLKQASQQGCQFMVSQCLNSSLTIYKKLNFNPCNHMALYRWTPYKT